MMVDRRQRRQLERRFDKAQRGGNMKTIKYVEEFRTAAGQPFPIQDPDVKVQKEARDKAHSQKKDSWDAPLLVEPTFAEVMVWFVNNIPHFLVDPDGKPLEAPRKITPDDTGNAYAVIQAFQDNQNGQVVMEDGVYRWLVSLNETEGTIAFRVTQAVVKRRLEDLVKEEVKAGAPPPEKKD